MANTTNTVVTSNTTSVSLPANVYIPPADQSIGYYMTLSSANTPNGFYNDQMFPDPKDIPAGAIKITEKQWLFYLDNQGSYHWDGSDFVFYTPTITTQQLYDYASEKRKFLEASGITINGIPVATDRASQQMVTQTISSLALVPNLTMDWKNPDGSFTTLNGDQVKAFGTYIAIYVAQTFTALKDVNAQIGSGTLTDYPSIDKAYSGLINPNFTTKSS